MKTVGKILYCPYCLSKEVYWTGKEYDETKKADVPVYRCGDCDKLSIDDE